MPDAFDDLQRAIDAAEQAAAAGNLATAEVHLHDVLRLQTGYVGEVDPDVAATLHKLGIVYERTGRLSEAEVMYRRAVAVASAVLPADDPLLIQCSEDLSSFLASAPSPEPMPEIRQAAPPAAVAAPVSPARPAPRVPAVNHASANGEAVKPHYAAAAPAATKTPAWVLATIGVVAALAIIALLWRTSARTAPEPATTAAPAAAPRVATPEPAPPQAAAPERAAPPAPAPASSAASTAQPSASASAAAAAPARPAPPPASAPAPVERAPAPAAAAAVDPPPARGSSSVQVLDAKLCRQLTPSGAWTCVAPENPPTAGRYYFLTRLATPAAVRIEHRWYRGDRLVQSVPLTIRAAGRAGFRTYSRQTVPEAQRGEWRVELRSAEGAVLAEERFAVQ